MSGIDAITLDTTGQILHWGYTTFTAGAGETLHTDVSKLVSGVEMKYNKMVGSVCTEMTQPEKDAVDAAEAAEVQLDSIGALELTVEYADIAALPTPPDRSGLLVRVTDTGDGNEGIAYSISGVWKIYSPGSSQVLRFPIGFPETISSNTALDPDKYVSRIDGNSRLVTLVDGTMAGQTKLIQTNNPGSCTLTLELESPNVSFDLPANSKAQIVWSDDNSWWFVIDEKNLTFNT